MRKSTFNYLPLFLLILFFFSFIQCKKETEPIEKDIIRPIIQLTTSDITTFNGMTQTRFGEPPWGFDEILSGIYTPMYEYRWVSEGEGSAYIDIWVADSKDLAFEILKEKQKDYTIPPVLLEQNKDIPAVVGDLSYFKGREFIRDNFIVKIHASDQYNNSISEIAKFVDSKILKSPTFDSATQVKPVIKTFELSKTPVTEWSQTLLTIQVDDPNDNKINYHWRFDKGNGYGSISTDDAGNYYWNSYKADANITSFKLTLIAINEFGFCANSTIYFQTIKE